MKNIAIFLFLLFPFVLIAQEQRVNIKVIPSDAIVIINGKIIKLTDGKATLTLPAEIEYTYSVACDGYEGVDGTFRLKSKSPFNLNVELNADDAADEISIADVTEDNMADLLLTHWNADNYGIMLQIIDRFPQNPASVYYKGCLYYYGLGIDKDKSKGVELWQQSAEHGVGDAYNRLGMIAEGGYFTGSTGGKANNLAAEYYKKGAELGNTMAKYNLALSYYSGSIKRNDKEAFRLFGEAARDGYANAMAYYARCIYLNYDKDHYKGVSEQERNAEALSWLRKAADNGSPIGCYYLGNAYYYGHMGLSSNTMEAYEWFKKGAEMGDSDCAFFIKEHYKL